MEYFNNKLVILVLTCKRPYYEQRLQKNSETFETLANLGVIVYCYANPALKELTLQKNNTSYGLEVPCLENYNNLSNKISLAYQYFSKTNCKGVLKIDDDAKIISPSIFQKELMDLVSKYDYFGVSERTILKRDGFLKYNTGANFIDHVYENIYHKIDYNIHYFEGPFYFVSKKALLAINKVGISILYEDVAVGYILTGYPDIKTFLWKNMFGSHIIWNDKDHEPQVPQLAAINPPVANP
jgi:hypothetical protein